MKKTLKGLIAVSSLFAALFTGCAGELAVGGSGTNVSNISMMKSRSLMNNMVYMGGSVLYSEENAQANQLAPNVTVATRIGKVNVTDTGCGTSVGVHDKKANYGYIVVNSVDMDSISFEYYQFPEDETNQKADLIGSYTVEAGKKCDMNGDGVYDVSYEMPGAGTVSRKTRMWFKFLRDGEHSAMFSVIPEQYEGGNYPGGLFGINAEGRSVVTKYDYSNGSSRAAVASIANGDYVLDTAANKIAVYHGSTIKSGSARALNESELSTEEFEGMNTVEDFEFKNYEFVSEYNIYKLLEALPGTVVTEAYSEKNISEAVAYLNRLVRAPEFLNDVLADNTSDTAVEIKNSLSGYSFTDDVQRVCVARYVLCMVYPDLCPEMTTLTNGIGEAFPELYINLGHMDAYEASSESARAVWGNFVHHEESEKLYPKKDVDKYSQEYLDYAKKYDEINSWFESLYYVDIADGIMSDWVGDGLLGIEDKDLKRLYKDFVKNLNLRLMVGAGGSVSCAGGEPRVEAKIAALAGFEIKDDITFSLSKGSFFEKKPGIEKAPTALERYKKLYPNSSISTEAEAKKFFENDHGYKSVDLNVVGTTGWVDTKDLDNGDMPSLSKDAKFKHVQFNPVKSFPVVVTFDVDFDLLRSLKISSECDNLYIGGVVIAGVEGHAGLNWGFSDKLFGCPLPWSFYCNFDRGGSTIFKHAYFAGFPQTDLDDTTIGMAVKGQVTPILKVRGGLGVGGDIWIAKTDVTLGGSFTAAAPITVLAGVNYTLNDGANVVLKANGKLMFNWGLDAQFYLDPPLVSEVKKTFNIYSSDVLAKYQLFKVTSENFGKPKWEGWKQL